MSRSSFLDLFTLQILRLVLNMPRILFITVNFKTFRGFPCRLWELDTQRELVSVWCGFACTICGGFTGLPQDILIHHTERETPDISSVIRNWKTFMSRWRETVREENYFPSLDSILWRNAFLIFFFFLKTFMLVVNSVFHPNFHCFVEF